MVLWKVSVLYSQPPWQLPLGCPLSRVIAPLWFKGTMQDTSGWPSGEVRRLKFEEAGAPIVGHVERHKWGGTAPVKTETSMWNARKIWGRQIHTYKIFWNFPKPPIRQRISSKFISLALCRWTLKMCCSVTDQVWFRRSKSAAKMELPKMHKQIKAESQVSVKCLR